MRLERLLSAVDVFDRPPEARKMEISGIAENTDQVQPGYLFACVVGSHVDGHNLAAEAVSKGAVALLTERELDVAIPQVRVPDTRAALAFVAAAFYDDPSRHLRMFGVTGTNGKTTTARLLSSILQAYKWKTTTIGTLEGQYTTPPPVQMQALLGKYRDEGRNAIVMEVSSAGLVQHRVDAIRFSAGIFTNLSQDHLDYHKTMQSYFEAKSRLFEPGRCEKAVINRDDIYGRRLIERLATPCFPFGLDAAENLEVGPLGSSFDFEGQHIELPLIGRFNVSNALAAITAARSVSVPLGVIAGALANVAQVPGRMERIEKGQPFTVIVDFAHTPDGLESVLNFARSTARQHDAKVAIVFGCGGDRDRAKRPHMGASAERLADRVIVTTDNARSEDPQVIANEVIAGMSNSNSAQVELDRRAAITVALKIAAPGDVVVIAGKGHEATQEIAGVKTSFDDRLIAGEILDGVSRT